jgi:hypothetical protein
MPPTISGDPNSMTVRRTISLIGLALIFVEAPLLCAGAGTPADTDAESVVRGAVSNEELTALANDVNLAAWTQLAASRDFTTIEEGWVAVYSPKDPVGAARNWSVQVQAARSLTVRASGASQKRWLSLFIRAGEAVGRKNTDQFTAALRALQSDSQPGSIAFVSDQNFFTAK